MNLATYNQKTYNVELTKENKTSLETQPNFAFKRQIDNKTFAYYFEISKQERLDQKQVLLQKLRNELND